MHYQHYNERIATVPLALIQSASIALSDRTQIPWNRTLPAVAGGGTGGYESRSRRAAVRRSPALWLRSPTWTRTANAVWSSPANRTPTETCCSSSATERCKDVVISQP